MKLIHTADWHLGQAFGPFSRDVEHARFLAWLLDVLQEEQADALVVCGDVFDSGNPNATAQSRYYDFLAAARAGMPKLDIVVVAGNHDAAPRLDAPGPVLSRLGVRVVGALPREAGGAVDTERCLVPLTGPSGDVEAWCAALPFLRMADLSPSLLPMFAGDPVVDGVAAAYGAVLDGARARRTSGEAIIALGHCHMAGARMTDESERPVLGGGHPLPADAIFPDDVAYAALGHLHFAQSVAGRDNVRYSGSPIPLSMAERAYRHAVTVVELNGPRVASLRQREIPRLVELLRVPEEAGKLDEILDRLRALDVAARPDDERPFLEVRVRLDAPAPDLRARVEQALEGKPVRLLRVHRELAGDGVPLADGFNCGGVVDTALADIEPVRVLERLYERTYGGSVPHDIASAFAVLLDETRVNAGAGGAGAGAGGSGVGT